MRKGLYTVIIAHYNQMNYIEEALKSVFMQDYSNIEIIVVDDFSSSFDRELIEKIMLKNKKKNIQKYTIYQNKKNLGTSRSLNGALKKANGEFIHLFAADDALYNSKVISNFVNEFEKNKEEKCVTAQCLMYDEYMKEQYAEYINVEEAVKRNEKTAIEQYQELAFACIYGAGGTAYRSEIFKELDGFDEKYKLVEDWSFWLKATRNGYKIHFADFKALKHREGGVSHSLHKENEVPPHVRQYYKDILSIYEYELLNNMKYFGITKKLKIINDYVDHVYYYSKSISDVIKEKQKIIKMLHFKYPEYPVFRIFRKLNSNKTRVLSFIIWFIISYYILEELKFNSLEYLILISTIFIMVRKIIAKLLPKFKKVINYGKRE